MYRILVIENLYRTVALTLVPSPQAEREAKQHVAVSVCTNNWRFEFQSAWMIKCVGLQMQISKADIIRQLNFIKQIRTGFSKPDCLDL
jgi:hypothetical protein